MIDKINNLYQQSKKNIILYFDEDGSFKEHLSIIEENNIKVIEINNNYFSLKYFLELEWQQEKLFIYHPYKKPDKEQLSKYPLLDVLMANTELRTDDASEFVNKFNLNPKFNSVIAKYIHILKTKTNQKKLSKILHPDEFTKEKLELGIISIILDFYTVTDKNLCISKLLFTATNTEEQLNKILAQLKEYNLDENMINWLNTMLPSKIDALSKETLIEVANIFKYNIIILLLKPLKADPYINLKINNSTAINRLEVFFDDWQQSPSLNKYIDTVFEELAYKVKEQTIIQIYGIEAEYGYYTPAMYQDLLEALYNLLLSNPIKVKDETTKWIRKINLEQRPTSELWFLYYTASFLEILNCYNSFKFNSANHFIKEYTSELFKIDYNYRKAVIQFTKIRDSSNTLKPDTQSVFNSLNDKYDRYLIELNVEWQSMLKEIDFQYNKIEVDKQYNFYKNNIANRDYKIAVIISDAFRYELGYELYLNLMSESKNNVALAPSLASIPSYTNLGMSNLLPNNGIEVQEKETDLSFNINKVNTVSTNRETILKQAEPQSTTISYADLVKYSRQQGRDLFKNNRVVYIYHDWIDAIGDKKGTEHQTFEATSKTVLDIKELINKIYGWNITHVLVTSDHGFLFNYNTLSENSREKLPISDGLIKEHTRFVISKKFTSKIEGYQFDLKNTTNINTNLKIAVPRAINRFRKQGNIGVQFAHGGPSLQEIITPVVTFYKQAKKILKPVTFKRIDSNNKINSNNLKVTILQDEAISNDTKVQEINLGIYSADGQLLSNKEHITFNATSSNPKERIFECILSLNQDGTKASFGYLKAFSTKDNLNPISINDIITINSLMGKDEF